MSTARKFFLYPAGLFVVAMLFISVAASILPGNLSEGIAAIARIAGAVAVSFILFTNMALVDYLIAISAGSDANRHRPTAIALSAIVFLALISFYAGIYVVEMPSTFALNADDLSFGACGARTVKAFYFSSVTITTVGYGEIFPRNAFAQITAAAEAINGLVAFGVFTGSLTGYISSRAGQK